MKTKTIIVTLISLAICIAFFQIRQSDQCSGSATFLPPSNTLPEKRVFPFETQDLKFVIHQSVWREDIFTFAHNYTEFDKPIPFTLEYRARGEGIEISSELTPFIAESNRITHLENVDGSVKVIRAMVVDATTETYTWLSFHLHEKCLNVFSFSCATKEDFKDERILSILESINIASE